MEQCENNENAGDVDLERRQFLTQATAAGGGLGLALAGLPLWGLWLPSARAKALGAPIEVYCIIALIPE